MFVFLILYPGCFNTSYLRPCPERIEHIVCVCVCVCYTVEFEHNVLQLTDWSKCLL